jgi:cyclic pyranopterin phosphate synthase
MNAIRDRFSRVIDYLRLSVTDRCNLRCVYCMPPEGIPVLGHRDILSYEEIIRIVEVAAKLGVRKVRLTGGEPLCRKNLPFLVSSIKKIRGIEDLSMTTNGTLLEKHAVELADAGLDRVNISIDSLRPDRYEKITRGGSLDAALKGLAAADKAGLRPVKINMVPVRGINEDEIEDFAKITLDSDYHVRFIECMPSANIDFWSPEKYITTDEIKGMIEKIAPLTPVRIRKNGPSKYFRLRGAKGVIGFISALTHHFCGDCNRLRLTSDGRLRPCLFSETEIDLLSALRSGAPHTEIERLLRLSIQIKPEGHTLGNRNDKKTVPDFLSPARKRKRPMSRIGG